MKISLLDSINDQGEADIEVEFTMSDTTLEKIDFEDVQMDYGFTQIVFQNIAPFYPDDAAVECTYSVSSDYKPASRDWVGLYRVGWMSPREYLYYEWAPAPNSERQASMLFHAHNLPGDDGEFYQFCYVSRGEEVLGASMPFQFKKPSAEDFVEVEEGADDMMVIYSKTQFLQKQLKEAEDEECKLIKKVADLEEQVTQMEADSQVATAQLRAAQSEAAQTRADNQTLELKIQDLCEDANNMSLVREELEMKISGLEKEKHTLESDLAETEEKLNTALKNLEDLEEEKDGIVKQLQSDRDALDGQIVMLNQKIQMYSEQLKEENEAHAKVAEELAAVKHHEEQLLKQVEQDKAKLEEMERLADIKQSELEENQQFVLMLKTEVERAENVLIEQHVTSVQEKHNYQDLCEKLRNAENKLAAAEESKQLMCEEMESYREAQHKLSAEVEKTKSENHSLKHHLEKTEKDLVDEISLLKTENIEAFGKLEVALEELRAKKEEVDSCEKKAAELERFLEQQKDKMKQMSAACKDSKAPILALRNVNDALKKTLTQRTEELKALKKASKQQESELLREISDLNMRVQMCRDEYKNLLQSSRKMERQLSRERGTVQKRKAENKEGADVPIIVEVAQKSRASSGSFSSFESSAKGPREEKAGKAKASASSGSKSEELRQRLAEEQERNCQLRRQHQEEMQRKDLECQRLRKQSDEQEIKIISMKKFLQEKDQIIAELNQQKFWLSQQDSYSPGHSRKSSMCSVEVDAKVGAKVSKSSQPGTSPVTVQPTKGDRSTDGDLAEDGSSTPSQRTPPVCRNIFPNPYVQPSGELLEPVRAADMSARSDRTFKGQMDMRYCHSSQRPPIPLRYPGDAVPNAIPLGLSGSEMKDIIPLGYPVPGNLPRPLSPVRSQASAVPSRFSEIPVWVDGLVPSAPVDGEEDRFEDARGEAMKICSHCKKSFPPDLPESDFVEHFMSHFGEFCPICKKQKDESLSISNFENHVLDCMERAATSPEDEIY